MAEELSPELWARLEERSPCWAVLLQLSTVSSPMSRGVLL